MPLLPGECLIKIMIIAVTMHQEVLIILSITDFWKDLVSLQYAVTNYHFPPILCLFLQLFNDYF